MIEQRTPIIDYSVRGLCCKPYPGQHEGCPNFKVKVGCPPGAPLFDKVFDINKPVYAIWNKFDLLAQEKRMLEAHPDWTQTQARCSRYWQTTARKQLTQEIKYFLILHKDYHACVAYCKGIENDFGMLYNRVIPSAPEAMGIQVEKTLGFPIWPVTNTTHQVALVGVKLGEETVKFVLGKRRG